MHEEALLLGQYQTNVGVFTQADNNDGEPSNMAVICITAGLLHHVGPHRMHVLFARELAKQGISTLRFDLSGIGDSAVRNDDLLAHEAPVRELNEAMHLLEKRGFTRFILFGICSGAVDALKAAAGNPKIAGLILLNSPSDVGNLESEPQLAAKFYLKKSLRNLNAWKNFFTGRVRYRALFHTFLSAIKHKLNPEVKKSVSYGDLLRASLGPYLQQGTSVISVMSDRNAQFYEMHKDAYDEMQSARYKVLVYKNSDHLFTSLAIQQDVIEQLCQWSVELVGANAESKQQFIEEMTG